MKRKDPKFDINLPQGSFNWSLLMCAVNMNRKEFVRYLLSFPGINVNHRSVQGNTVLRACNQVSILKLLLGRKDLDVNIQNRWGETRLLPVCGSDMKYV